MLLRSRVLRGVLVVVLSSTLAACGESEGSAEDEGPGVEFSGAVGSELAVEWSEADDWPEETQTTALVEGDGDVIGASDTVNAFLFVGNATDQEQVYNDYDNGAPQQLPVAQITEGVLADLLDGATYGSRVQALTTAEGLFPEGLEGNPLGLVAGDEVVVVVDLVSAVEQAPTPTSDRPQDADPSSQPTVVEEGGRPVGLDFTGIEEPALDAPVQRVVLDEGDGPKVGAGATVTVDYLGSTYAADAPFDQSYATGDPLVSPLGGLIPGWSIGLTGVRVGSRVLLQIPPAFGYGTQGSGADIPGNSTLWFLIDIIKAE
ncbi:FKBP-type peptidyl-prolyl cis-trans isomerase [Nocardioides stalactiti]|uniref:FKBP-type peptidyl-prolyl cis-trans isomerase n=1 Tax=Nocardioides stalactiti TaxID=2755356 RepID=UPI0015FF2D6D|nr:FKBP-type peptidyl-prolyl cis-trans isomerase [Nocardioides stalactiti]